MSDRLRAALEAAGDVAYLWDLENDRIEWSGRIAGVAIDPAVDLGTGRGFAGHIFPEDLPRRRSRLAEHCNDGAAFACEYRLRDAAGELVWVIERGRVERNGQGQPARMLGVVHLRGDAGPPAPAGDANSEYDALTGHIGRPRLREAVARIVAANARSGTPAAFLAVGVDDVPAVARRFGRAAAEALLVEVGRRLDLCLRVSDVIGRLGEDGFGIMLACCPREQIAAAGRRISQAVAASPIATSRGRLRASVSIGAVACPQPGPAADELIARAEGALVEARATGRGGWVEVRPGRKELHAHRRGLLVGAAMREAMRDGRLLFAFQPVVSATTGEVDYFECLLRQRDGAGRISTGGELVKASEKLGFIGLIDRFALDSAARELAAHPDVRLGLNVSGLTAGDRRWLRSLTSLLHNNPEWARRLVVEITETATLGDLDECARFVSSLKEAGCRVALDDFGAGHTTLEHLTRLPVDTVKIDGSLVRNLWRDRDKRVLLRHLLGHVRGYGFATLAECVETEEDAAILRSEGVGFLQGYHVGRPSIERAWLPEPLLPAAD